MTTVWDGLLPEVLPYAQGASRSMAVNAVHGAAVELCAKGLVWREELAAMDVVAGEDAYAVSPPAGAGLALILDVRLNGSRLRPATDELLDRDCPSWASLEAERPTRYLVRAPATLRLVPRPTATFAGGLTVRAALLPARPDAAAQPAQEVADWLLSAWRDALAAGARSRLLRMPGKEWTDLQTAGLEERRFLNGLARAKNARLKGGTSISLSAGPRAFGE